MNPADVAELAPLYSEETKLSESICFALLRANLDPPPRWRVDAQGWTEPQRVAIEKHYPFSVPASID